MTKAIKTFADVEDFLKQLPRSTNVVFTGNAGIKRSRQFFKLLGDPQNTIPVVHIAGTSGKGSTGYMIAALLAATGKKVGFSASPHVYDLRERMLINGKYVVEAELCEHLNTLLPVLDEMKSAEFGQPSYFEINLALAWLTFVHHKVDYAVIETGLGGRLDATNTITRADKVAVLTAIGYDHTAVLGETLPAIANEKAGIIQPKNHVIALHQRQEVDNVFTGVAATQGAELELMEPDKHLKNIRADLGLASFDLELGEWNWQGLTLNLSGAHQLNNALLALRTAQYVADRDHLSLDENQAQAALGQVRLPARFEIRRTKDKVIILDGAHNPQKMEALAQTLAGLFPEQKISFLIALKQDKDRLETLKQITPLAEHITLTSFYSDDQDLINQSARPAELASDLEKIGYDNFNLLPNSKTALKSALKQTKQVLVITGSFYLIGQLRSELDML